MSARRGAAWAILAGLVIFACGGGGSPSGQDTDSTGGSVGSGGLGGTGGEQETLSDAQIVKVLETTHASRVAEARIAKARSQDQQVIEYAEEITAEHQSAGAELAALEKQRALTPADSKLSLTIAATSSVEVDNLSAVASADFDKTYLQAQVTDHGKAMSAVDALMGMTADSDLKSALTALKTMSKAEHGRATALLSSR